MNMVFKYVERASKRAKKAPGKRYVAKGKKKEAKGKSKVKKVMKEFGSGELHSGSKKGPVVHSQRQAVAIALSEARKAGAKIPKKGKKK